MSVLNIIKISLVLPLILALLATPTTAWMQGWSNRLTIDVINQNPHITFTDYQINITLSSPEFDFAKANIDGSDLRFTWFNNSVERTLPFWIETWNSSDSHGDATVWVKIPVIDNRTIEKIYMYYGNGSATSASDSKSTFGSSSANLSIPGCTLGDPCIVSANQVITTSGNYGHPYIRINPGVTLSIAGSNTIVYFNSTGRVDIFGTLYSTGGGASNGTDGGKYYGKGAGGRGGTGNNNALPGGLFGGGGSGKGGCNPVGTAGGSFGGGGGTSWGTGCDPGESGGTGAFLSINTTILNIKTSGSIIVGIVSYAGCPAGGGGALLQLLNISTLIFNGTITVTGGSGGQCYNGEGGGGGALFYLNNYSTTIGLGTFAVQGGSSGAGGATGGIATLNIQDSSLSSAAGGSVIQQFSLDGAELYGRTLFFEELEYSTSIQPSPTEIGNDITIRLNYTYASNSSPVTGATINLTIFDTTPSHAVLTGNIFMTYVLELGLWQYNYTVPNGVNGTYKYNIKGNVSGLYGSDFDVNGTFDTKDTTAPQVSGVGAATACSGYSNYRFANSPFEVTFSATDNWQIDWNSSFCNFTMSNYTSAISQITASNCSFPSVGPAGSATVRILVNDTMNNTASATLGITVVDSCPVQPTTPTPSTSSSSGSSGGSGGGGGGGGGGSGVSTVSTTISEGGLPEIIFENRALSLVQEQPERVKITLKNPKNEQLRVTLNGPSEVSFDENEFTLSPGGEKEVYATLSYLTAGEYKPMISAQLGDLKRMYDLSVTVVKREADAVEQLLIDAQKAVNSLILLKYKACENDVNAVKSKAIAIETLAGDIRSAYLLSKGTMPSAAKIEELKRELSALSGFRGKIEECKPTTIQQKPSTDAAVQKPKNTGNLLPFVMTIMVLLFGAGIFRVLRRGS